MRVLHVIPYYEPAFVYGGPTRCVPQLCKALARAGVEVTVLTTNANGAGTLDVPIGRGVEVGGVEVIYYPRTPPLWTFRSPQLAAGVRARGQSYDLIHINGVWSYPAEVAATWARRHGKPYVFSPHGSLMPWVFGYKAYKRSPYFHLRARRHLQRSSGIHCTSEVERAALTRWGLHRQAFVVPNAIDFAEFERLPARGAMRQRLGIDAAAHVVLFLGRLHAKKGIELLLDSFLQIANRERDVHLVLAGADEGGYAASVPAWAVHHDLARRVHVPGELTGNDRLAAYSDADVFALLSPAENFAMSVAEAMACGLPVVVTPGVGISSAVRGSNAGIVVNDDSSAIARHLQDLLERPDLRREMGRSGMQLVRQEYAADAVGHSMLREYARMLT